MWLILNPPKLRNQKLQKERSNMQSRTTLAIHKWQSLFVKQVLWLCIRIKSVLFWQCNYVSEKSWTKHWQDAQAQSLNSYFHSKSPVMEKLLQEIMMMIPRLPTHWFVIGTSSMQYSLPLYHWSSDPVLQLSTHSPCNKIFLPDKTSKTLLWSSFTLYPRWNVYFNSEHITTPHHCRLDSSWAW